MFGCTQRSRASISLLSIIFTIGDGVVADGIGAKQSGVGRVILWCDVYTHMQQYEHTSGRTLLRLRDMSLRFRTSLSLLELWQQPTSR